MAFGGDETVTTTNKTEGGSTSKTVTRPMQHEYYKQLLGQANNLYKKGIPKYYGGATVAGMTPAQMESMNQAANWTTGGAQDMMATQNQQYQQMMSGRVNTGEGSPYGDMANVYQQQAMEGAQDMMGQLRSSQVMSGQAGGSTRGDLMNNQVIDQANQNVQNNLAGMYNNAYNQAQTTQQGALSQYGSIMNMPLQMSQALFNQVGLPQQQLNQGIMNDAKAKYDYNSSRPWQNLAQFGNFITGNFGGTNTGNSTSWGNTDQTQTQS